MAKRSLFSNSTACEDAEIVRKDGLTGCSDEVFPAFVEATVQSEDAFQERDAALDTGSKSLRQPEERLPFALGFFGGSFSLLAD
jgi:hypothetical protein